MLWNLKSYERNRRLRTFFSMDKEVRVTEILLELLQCGSFTVTFYACIAFVPCDGLNFSRFYVFCRYNSDYRRSQRMVVQRRVDSCSLRHPSQYILQYVMAEFTFLLLDDV